MSFWSALADIGLGIAAPFTGGATAAFIPAANAAINGLSGGDAASAAGNAGQVLGGQQAGTNNARIAQGQLNQGADRNAVDLYNAQQQAQNQAAQLDLQRQQYATGNRATTAKQALIGALLGGGLTPTTVGPHGASGGLLRSLNANPNALAAMQTLGQQASTAQNTPLSFTGGNLIKAPTLTPIPQINAGDGTAGNIAKTLQLVGSASPFLQNLLAKKPNPDDMTGLVNTDNWQGVGGDDSGGN